MSVEFPNKEYLDECYTKNPAVTSRKMFGQVVLVPIRKSAGDLKSVYTLNDTGARIWELIDGKRKMKDVKELIVREYDVSSEKAENDIFKLLEQLKEVGAVCLSEKSDGEQRE